MSNSQTDTYVCHCSAYQEEWELLEETSEDGNPLFPLPTGEKVDDWDLCTMTLHIYEDAIRLISDHESLKVACGLPATLCDALCDILQRNVDGLLPDVEPPHTCVWLNHEASSRAILEDQELILFNRYFGDELKIVLSQPVFTAFQEAFLAHGAQFGDDEEEGL